MVIKIISKEIRRIRALMSLVSGNPKLWRERHIELRTLRRVLALLLEEKFDT